MRLLEVGLPDQKPRRVRRDVDRLRGRAHGPWNEVGNDGGQTSFDNSWGNAGGDLQVFRYRWILGGGTELQGSITGGTLTTVACTLPPGFRPEKEVRLPAIDDTGAVVVIRILATGDVIIGV